MILAKNWSMPTLSLDQNLVRAETFIETVQRQNSSDDW